MRPSSSPSALGALLTALLTACQPLPPLARLASARPASTLPPASPGPELVVGLDHIVLSDVTMRRDIAPHLLAPPDGPAHNTRLMALERGVAPGDAWMLEPLHAALRAQQRAMMAIEDQLIDEEDAPRLRLRVSLHPELPYKTALRVLYTAGQAEMSDPQLLLAHPSGTRAITLDTPRIGAPAAPAPPAGRAHAQTLLDMLGRRDRDAPCRALTMVRGADGVTLRQRALRQGHVFTSAGAAAPDEYPAIALTQAELAPAPLEAKLAALPGPRCGAMTFVADGGLTWQQVAPAMEAARTLAGDGQLYLSITR